MNLAIFTGRTTKDIELRYTSGEKATAVAKFSLAVDSGYGDNKKTNFFNLTAWGKTAETMEKLVKKGTKIFVQAEPTQNQYTDKNGNKINAVDFRVLNFEFAESKGNNNSSQAKPSADDSFMLVPDGIGDELPFA